METTGSILKRRIKEMGYRQLDFAEACQISGTSLKKYMKDQLPFSVELLKKFAELLDCSTDYLLGQAETPQKEIQTLKELTHLSDGALLFLEMSNILFQGEAGDEHTEDERKDAERDLITVSLLLEDRELLPLIGKWLYFDGNDELFGTPNGFTNFIEVGGIFLRTVDIQDALLLRIQERLNAIKADFQKINKENREIILTREVPENVKERTRKWIDPQEK